MADIDSRKIPKLLRMLDLETLYRRARVFTLALAALTIMIALVSAEMYRGLKADADEAMSRWHSGVESYFASIERTATSLYYQLATDYQIEKWTEDAYRPEIDYYSMYLTFNQITNIVRVHTFLKSIYLYTYGNDRVLSTTFMFSPLETFPQRAVYGTTRNGWLPSLWERTSGANAGRVLPLTLPVPLDATKGRIVLNVDEAVLLANAPWLDIGVVLTDKEGQVLSSNNTRFIALYENHKDLVQQLEVEAAPYRVDDGDIDSYMLLSSQPGQYWRAVSFIDATRIDRMIAAGMRKPYIALGAFIASLFLSVALTLVVRRLSGAQRRLVSESMLQSRFSRKAELIGQLLLGTIKGTDGILNAIGDGLFKHPYRIATFELNGYYRRVIENQNVAKGEINLALGALRTAIRTKWKESDKENVKGKPVDGKSDRIQPLVHHIELNRLIAILPVIPTNKPLPHMLHMISENVRSEAHSFSIAVSDEVSGADMASEAYLQTVRMLSLAPFFNKDAVLFHEDIKELGNSFSFPVAQLSWIVSLVNRRNDEGVEAEIDAALDGLLKACGYNMDMANAALANIMFELVKIRMEGKSDPHVVIEGDIFLKLYSFDSIDEKLQLIRDLCLKTVRERRGASSNSDSMFARRIDAYIHEQFDKGISLTQIADEFKMSASYISTLIKRELGLNYSNYINELRVRKSISMLRDSNATIREIAGKCGYEDVHTFIRNFKRIHHTTPAEYRKVHWGGARDATAPDE
jgi:AraC-like DNA-binding protein